MKSSKLKIILLLLTALCLSGCYQVTSVTIIHEIPDTGAQYDYGAGHKVYIPRNENAIIKINFTTDQALSNVYFTSAWVVPKEVTFISGTMKIAENTYTIKEVSVPPPSSTGPWLNPATNSAYKWIVIAPSSGDGLPQKIDLYPSGNKGEVEIKVNVGEAPTGKLFFTEQAWFDNNYNYNAPNWKVLETITQPYPDLKICKDFTGLPHRGFDEYKEGGYIVLSNKTAVASEEVKDAKGLYLSSGVNLIASNLSINADKIIIEGVIDASGFGGKGEKWVENPYYNNTKIGIEGKDGSPCSSPGKGGGKGGDGAGGIYGISDTSLDNQVKVGEGGEQGAGGGKGGDGHVGEDGVVPVFPTGIGAEMEGGVGGEGGEGGVGGDGGNGGGIIKLKANKVVITASAKIINNGKLGDIGKEGKYGNKGFLGNTNKDKVMSGGKGGYGGRNVPESKWNPIVDYGNGTGWGGDGEWGKKPENKTESGGGGGGGGGGAGGNGGPGAGGGVLIDVKYPAGLLFEGNINSLGGDDSSSNGGTVKIFINGDKASDGLLDIPKIYDNIDAGRILVYSQFGGELKVIPDQSWYNLDQQNQLNIQGLINSGGYYVDIKKKEDIYTNKPVKIAGYQLYYLYGKEKKYIAGENEFVVFSENNLIPWYITDDDRSKINGKDFTLILAIKDKNGNISEIKRLVKIDSTPPQKPIISFSSIKGGKITDFAGYDKIYVNWWGATDKNGLNPVKVKISRVKNEKDQALPSPSVIYDWINTGQAKSSGSYPISFSAWPSGTYKVEIRADDLAGNASTGEALYFRDVDPPETSVLLDIEPNKNGWHNKSVGLNFKVFDLAGIQATYYSINGGPEQKSPLEFTADGKYLVSYYSIDKLGHKEGKKSITVNLDQLPPTCKILFPNKGSKEYDLAGLLGKAIKVEASDSVSGIDIVACSIKDDKDKKYFDGKDFSSNTANILYLTYDGEKGYFAGMPADKLVPGKNYIVSVWAIDKAGNSSKADQTSFTFVGEKAYVAPDSTPPVVQLLIDGSPIEGGKWTNQKSIALKANDTAAEEGGVVSGIKMIYYSINGKEQPAVKAATKSIYLPDEGMYAITAWAEDNAGLVGAKKEWLIKIDSTSPNVSIEEPKADASGIAYNPSPIVVYARDPLSNNISSTLNLAPGINQVKINSDWYALIPDGVVEKGGVKYNKLIFKDFPWKAGDYTITARIFDNAGNVKETSSDKFNVIMLQAAPDNQMIKAVYVPANWVGSSAKTITFTLSGLEGIAKYYYGVNEGYLPEKAKNNPAMGVSAKATLEFDLEKIKDVLKQGENILYAAAENQAGLVNLEKPAKIKFYYDTQAPAAPYDLKVSPEEWTDTAEWTITASKPKEDSGVKEIFWKIGKNSAESKILTVDDWDGYQIKFNIKPEVIGEGEQEIKVWFKDFAGNVDENNAAVAKIRFDKFPPENPQKCEVRSAPGKEMLASNQEYSYKTPCIEWSGASDGSGSGVAGYAVYFGPEKDPPAAITPDKYPNMGSFVSGTGADRYLVVITKKTSFTVPDFMTTGKDYYLRIKTMDQAGRISNFDAAPLFIYKYIGIFIQKLMPNYNWISVPLPYNSSVYDFWTYLSSQGFGPVEIAKPAADGSGGMEKYYPGGQFSIEYGKCYRVKVGKGKDLVMTGVVPASETGLFSLKTGENVLYLPLNFKPVKASELYLKLGLSADQGDAITLPEKGSIGWQLPYDGTEFGVDFNINPGDVFQVKTYKDIPSWP